jgi:hypothetical protein
MLSIAELMVTLSIDTADCLIAFVGKIGSVATEPEFDGAR